MDAIFKRIKGVESVVSGYAGGEVKDPSYHDVTTGKTGHAEVLKVGYDPAVISLSELLDIFFALHDPTTLNRQGADMGTQYRSVIFCENSLDADICQKKISDLTSSHEFTDPIVTEVKVDTEFYDAEKYHQDYYDQNRGQPYCEYVISPKIKKLLQMFGSKVKEGNSEKGMEEIL